jgi:molecular chaperone GrpE (heat shock protein)
LTQTTIITCFNFFEMKIIIFNKKIRIQWVQILVKRTNTKRATSEKHARSTRTNCWAFCRRTIISRFSRKRQIHTSFAEFETTKRTSKERIDLLKLPNQSFASTLPVLDDFDRAIEITKSRQRNFTKKGGINQWKIKINLSF